MFLNTILQKSMKFKLLFKNLLNFYFILVLFTIFSINVIKSEETKDIEKYVIDPFHSSLVFTIKNYAQLGNIVVGKFNKIEGMVLINNKDFSKSKVSIKIDVNSLDTGWEERDKHLLGPQFFNAQKYPFITFESKYVKTLTNNEFLVNGDLTMLNTTKNINIVVKEVNKGKNFMGKDIIVYEFNYSLNRSDFGMNSMLDLVGDKVDITSYIQVNKMENNK